MTQVEQIDVLIVGAGPAGMSTALHLAQANPQLVRQGRAIVVDKAMFPREKLCGGGITRPGAQTLARLGLSFETPHVLVRELRVVYQDLAYAVRDNPVFRVVRRAEFDAWLVHCGQQRGVTVHQGEAVKDVRPGPDYVEVVTERATYHAQVVVAADGSRSFVRQRLKWASETRLARLLEVLTPESADQAEFRDGIATLDFSPMATGLQGYYWDFPSLVNNQPFMNRGVFDSRVRPDRPRVDLRDELARAMSRRGRHLADYELKGHPIHWFEPAGAFARPRVILAGDAAGIDPLLGEGIAFALGYGEVAAGAILEALASRDFSFRSYRQKILAHPLLAQLSIRAFLAQSAYRLTSAQLVYWFWSVSPLLVRTLAWFNRDYVPVESPRLARIPAVLEPVEAYSLSWKKSG